MENIENLHAHVSTSMSDCDGRMNRNFVSVMNDDERASEFGELEFKSRMLSNLVSWSYANKVEITPFEDGSERIEVSYMHDEGSFHGEALTCTDDCDDDYRSQSDLYAEMMGY